MDADNVNVKRFTEKELARELQAHFRRFVAAVKIARDEASGEPVLYIEFDKLPAREGR